MMNRRRFVQALAAATAWALPYQCLAGAGKGRVGAHEHTHFMFRVLDQGGDYLLDPWILFWEMFRQQRRIPGTK